MVSPAEMLGWGPMCFVLGHGSCCAPSPLDPLGFQPWMVPTSHITNDVPVCAAGCFPSGLSPPLSSRAWLHLLRPRLHSTTRPHLLALNPPTAQALGSRCRCLRVATTRQPRPLAHLLPPPRAAHPPSWGASGAAQSPLPAARLPRPLAPRCAG